MPRTPRATAVLEDEDTVADFLSVPEDTPDASATGSRSNPYPAAPYRTLREHHPAPDNLGGRNVYRALDLIQIAYQNGFQGFTNSHIEIHMVPIIQGFGKNIRIGPEMEPMAVATVTGVFLDEHGEATYHSATADATPSNCTVAPAFVRMAETRAQGRLLRTAMGMDANATEEFGSESDVVAPSRNVTPFRTNGRTQSATANENRSFDSSKFPPPNDGDGYACEECGKAIIDTAKSPAGQKALWSMQKTGQILCWDHQQAASGG